MDKKLLTTHTMIRDEISTVGYGLWSIKDYCEKMIVTDTGSVDGTYELIEELSDYIPQIELEKVEAEDHRDWRWSEKGLSINFDKNTELGKIRRSHISRTTSEFSWILDGDEVYCNTTSKRLVNLLDDGINGVYVPFLHFAQDYYHTAFGFPFYGRIFRTDKLTLENEFPDEQHAYDGITLFPGSPNTLTLDSSIIHPVHHYQMVYKPHRRVVQNLVSYTGPQPEVFENKLIQDLVEKHRVQK